MYPSFRSKQIPMSPRLTFAGSEVQVSEAEGPNTSSLEVEAVDPSSSSPEAATFALAAST